jgi:hypothetical protein
VRQGSGSSSSAASRCSLSVVVATPGSGIQDAILLRHSNIGFIGLWQLGWAPAAVRPNHSSVNRNPLPAPVAACCGSLLRGARSVLTFYSNSTAK